MMMTRGNLKTHYKLNISYYHLTISVLTLAVEDQVRFQTKVTKLFMFLQDLNSLGHQIKNLTTKKISKNYILKYNLS